MSLQKIIRGRYEIKEIIGRGGMGVVYRAFDPLMKRDVAVKTLHDVSTQVVLDLFYRECDILRGIVHPNIVDILDMGEYEDEGVSKPYYVMPLLPGKTLYALVHSGPGGTPEPLSMDRAVEIIAQTCRGLHAAHEARLLHRDVKPQNIFVIDAYSVKLIDFGVAHLLGSNSSTGVKGTLQYMAPEQLKMKPLSRRTDIFSLAVVCYEILTGKQPFRGATDSETAAAVVGMNPPLASEINPQVPKVLAQVVAKGMAKDPWSRFATAADFADALQMARRNEPMTHLFDPSETLIRMERARQSYEEKDYQFASEILRELEAEGQTDSDLLDLRKRVDEALLRESAASLLENAERYFRAEEYSLALRKVQEILELDPHHAGALTLKRKIEGVQSERRVAELLQTASEKLQSAAFADARKALQDALKLRPDHTGVRQLLAEVDSRQKDFLKQRQEQERLYQASQAAWVQRDISLALLNLEKLAELARKTPEPRDRIIQYKDFYKLVRQEHDALLAAMESARQKAAEEDFNGALALCTQFLTKYAKHPGLTSLKSEIEEQQKTKAAAYRADIEQQLAQTPLLDQKQQILESARFRYPHEPYFHEQLDRVRQMQSEVTAIAEFAQIAEQSGDFDEAIEHWQKMSAMYPVYPGLADQLARVQHAREQARAEARLAWVSRIRAAIEAGNVEEAERTLDAASAEFPGELENEKAQLETLRKQKSTARAEFARAKKLASSGDHLEAAQAFGRAWRLDANDVPFHRSIVGEILATGRSVVNADWRAAESYLQAATALERDVTIPADLRQRIDQHKKADYIGQLLPRVAQLVQNADFRTALRELDSALSQYPRDTTLSEKRAEVEQAQLEHERRRIRESAMTAIRDLGQRADGILNGGELDGLLAEARALAQRFSQDPEIYRMAVDTGQMLMDLKQCQASIAAGDLNAARMICQMYLQKNPEHQGFQEMSRRIADREFEISAEYMDGVHRRLAQEPALDARLKILEEAQKRYPDEQHYRDELALVRDELALVQNMIEEAGSFEKAGLLKDALDQWSRLKAIYPHHPGLDNQIVRLTELTDRKRKESRASWAKQIDEAISKGDLTGAGDLLSQAQLEFPGEFEESRKKIREISDQRNRANQLLTEAANFARRNNWSNCQNSLRGAVTAAARDAGILDQAADAHLKYAQAAMKNNPQAAESLLAQAAELFPKFDARDLLERIAEQKRGAIVDTALAEADRLQKAGDAKAAIDALGMALAEFPGEPKLVKLKETLEAQVRERAEAEARERDLAEMRNIEQETRTVSGAELALLLQRAQALAKHHTQDKEFDRFTKAISEQYESMQQARKALAEGRFEDSEKITDKILSKFSDQSIFLALNDEIKSARAAAAAAYLDDITATLSNTPDLARREEILMAAVAKYPDETYYQRELELVRQERALIEEMAAKARSAEAEGRHSDALDHWKHLRTIYALFPNLDAEIERLNKQVLGERMAAIDAALAPIAKALDQGDLANAEKLLAGAESRFETLGENGDQLRARLQAQKATMALAGEGQALIGKGRHKEGLQKIRDAAQTLGAIEKLDRKAAAQAGVHLAVVLLDGARAAAASDWRVAREMCDAAKELDRNADTSAVEAAAQERQREEVATQALDESRKQIDAGELRLAEETVRRALTELPGNTELTLRMGEIRGGIEQKKLAEQREKVARELAALEKEAAGASLKRLRQLTKLVPMQHGTLGAADLETRAAALAQLIAARIAELEAPKPKATPAAPPPQPKPEIPSHLLLKREGESSQVPLPDGRGSVGAAGGGAATVGAGRPAAAPGTNWKMIGGIAAAAVVVFGGAFYWFTRGGSSSGTQVSVTSTLAGVAVTVGQQNCVTPDCNLKLAPGSYTLTASKDGYAPVRQSLTVAKDAQNVPLTMMPLEQVLQINTNFESGRVFVDGKAAGDLRDGQLTIRPIAAGRHTVRVTGGGADFQADWQSEEGSAPKLVSAISAKETMAAVVANAGKNGSVACNCGAQSITVDGNAQGQTAAGSPTPLENLSEGTHRLAVGQQQMVVDIRQNPTVNVFLALDRNVGTLIIATGEDNARVFLNNRLYRRLTEHGTVRIPTDVGEYNIRVEKDGYRSPVAQRVNLQKGEEKQVTFALTPVPSYIDIAGAQPGAQVRIDGQTAATVAGNGTVRVEASPGEHEVELALDDFNSARFRMTVTPGAVVRPTAGQVAMTRVVRQPDPVQLEQQEWDRVRNTASEGDLQDFLRRYPNGAHAEEARAAAARLRQQAQDKAAAQAEQADWDRVDKSNKGALQGHINRYRNGPHTAEAQRLIDGIDRADAEEAAAKQAQQEAANKQKAKQAQQEAEAKQAAAQRLAADVQSVGQTLTALQTAYASRNIRNVQAIWPGAPADLFRFGKIDLQLTPTEQPIVNGNTATVVATRRVQLTPDSGPKPPVNTDRVRVTLERSGLGWVIRGLMAF